MGRGEAPLACADLSVGTRTTSLKSWVTDWNESTLSLVLLSPLMALCEDMFERDGLMLLLLLLLLGCSSGWTIVGMLAMDVLGEMSDEWLTVL